MNRMNEWHYIKDGKPKKVGLYLCYRVWNSAKVYELIYWTGDFWSTLGNPEDRIIAWCELPEPPQEVK